MSAVALTSRGLPVVWAQTPAPDADSGPLRTLSTRFESVARKMAPSVVAGIPWMRRFGDAATAFVSGWTLHRGARRWRSMERGFALSDQPLPADRQQTVLEELLRMVAH